MRVKLKWNSIIAFFVFFGLLDLNVADYVSYLDVVNKVLRVLSGAGALILYFTRKREKISILTITVLLMQGWMLVSTLLNGSNLWRWLIDMVSIMAVVLVFESMSTSLGELIDGLMVLGELVCYTNLITIILFPGGLYQSELYSCNWLLGHKNLFAPYLMVFCVSAFLYRCQGGKRWREWGIYISSVASCILADSATSSVGLILLIVLLQLIRVIRFRFNPYMLISLNAIIYTFVVFLSGQRLFKYFIEIILNKNLTFTGRVALWDRVINLILQKPVIGYGSRSGSEIRAFFQRRWASHAHNIVLQYLFSGGFIFLALYIVMLIICAERLRKQQISVEAQSIMLVLFVFQIMALMEAYQNAFVYILYGMAFHVGRMQFSGKTKALSRFADGRDRKRVAWRSIS